MTEVRVQVEVNGGMGTIFPAPKTFSTGSKGYFGQGKVEGANGKRYQVQVQLVEIGSKPR